MSEQINELDHEASSPKKTRGVRLGLSLAAAVVVLSALVGMSVGRSSESDGVASVTTESTESIEWTEDSIAEAPNTPEGTSLTVIKAEVGDDVVGSVEIQDIPEVLVASYDFDLPAPEGEMMTTDWFSDAVFIGDSRTEGLSLYSGILGSTFLCCKGISIFDVLENEDEIIFRDGTYYTILEALTLGSYSKVYISLGINELGYYNDQKYEDAFVELIAQVRAIQPDAVIYIQTIVPVNPERALERGQPDYVNNDRIADYNAILRKVTGEEQVVLLETAIALADEEGILPYDASTDGVHFVKAWYELWRDYLLNHTVDASLYFNSQT